MSEIKIYDNTGKHIHTINAEQMPLKFIVQTSTAPRNFNLKYTYEHTEKKANKIKGIVLNTR